MSNVLAWWKMAGNLTDSSGNGYSGTNEGASLNTDRFGNANNAYSFNGTSSYISIGTTPVPTSSSTFSITAWVYPTSLNQDATDGGGGIGGTIINADSDGDTDGYDLGIKNNNKIWWWPAANDDIYSSTSISLDVWTHIAICVNSTTTTMYINGVLDSAQTTVVPQTPSFLQIGSACHITGYWAGKLTDIRLYNASLSANAVKQIYQQFNQASNFFSAG